MAKKRKIKKHSKAWQHTDKILEMYRGGKTLTGIENALGLDGVLVKPAEYPKFQKNKEYLFTTDTRPRGGNPTATKDPLYVFVCAIDSPYRKYPLYLFRHKKAGWRETFTPMQLMEFKVSAAAGATK